MPGSGPVYQPTTVSYEQHEPNGYLSQTSRHPFRTAKCLQLLLLIFGLFSLTTGFIMVVESSVDISNAHHYGPDSSETSEGVSVSDYVVIFVGCIAITLGLSMICLYLKNESRYRNWSWPCFSTKEQRLARQLRESQASNGQILTLNPSTDLLVTAQYAPVPQPQQPGLPGATLAHEEEERSKLMGNDNKDCDLERCSSLGRNSGSRYYRRQRKISMALKHRPSFTASNTGVAPLACSEEVTPSLRSSFASVYFNMTPYDSEMSLDKDSTVSMGSNAAEDLSEHV